MMNSEWRILFVRILAASVFAWGLLLGYLLTSATGSGRIIAAVVVVLGAVPIVWAFRKLR